MNRRQFVAHGSLAAALTLTNHPLFVARAGSGPEAQGALRVFSSDDADLMRVSEAALSTLHGNVVQLPAYPGPVLIEGSVYNGVWMECAPQEGAVYGALGSKIARSVARNNHLIFFALQKDDGQIPYSVRGNTPGFGQIQMVVPIAATAWELARKSGDSELLEKAYAACGRWDMWLRRYRNTRGSGLCEGFCTWDTGQDNSPRWKGIPNTCPDRDARRCPQAEGLPRLCPDLSATVYGGRAALALMAKALGRNSEADRWTEDAEAIRRLIVDKLYDPQDGAFYDLDADNKFVRVRSTAILRVLGEHVVDAELFKSVWTKQVHDPHAFWAPYPFPSVALDDPAFVRPVPRNSWGGAAQALTALRAPRWMEHYGKPAELGLLMQRWIEALLRAAAINQQGAINRLFSLQGALSAIFRQQLDPLTGEFTEDDPGGYSPAALVFFDFLWRLSGVREQDDLLEWNVHPPTAQGRSSFAIRVGAGTAQLIYDGPHAEMRLAGGRIAQVSGAVRLLTTRSGEMRAAVGISEEQSHVTVRLPGRPARALRVAPNTRVELRAAKPGT